MAGTRTKKDDGKRKKTAKKKKDPNAPKRSKSAYMFFCEDKRAEVKGKNPELKMTDISKKLAELWRAIEASDKKVNVFKNLVLDLEHYVEH